MLVGMYNGHKWLLLLLINENNTATLLHNIVCSLTLQYIVTEPPKVNNRSKSSYFGGFSPAWATVYIVQGEVWHSLSHAKFCRNRWRGWVQEPPKFYNLVRIVVFWLFFHATAGPWLLTYLSGSSPTVCTDQTEIWHWRIHHQFSVMYQISPRWGVRGGYGHGHPSGFAATRISSSTRKWSTVLHQWFCCLSFTRGCW